MSVAAPLAISALPPFEHERKRTSSFSVPQPKARRTGTLQRTPSFLTLPLCDLPTMELYGRAGPPRPAVSEPHPRSLKRRESQWTSHALDFQSFVASTAQQQQPPPAAAHKPAAVRAYTAPAPATSPVASSSRLPPSPLSGAQRAALPPSPPRPRKKRDSPRRFLPPRERYPSARDEPDLYRHALVQRLRAASPAGAQIVLMGARAAVAMLEATAALERLVAEGDMDLDLSDDDAEGEPDEEHEHKRDPRLGESWVDVRAQEDWEMVDQSANA